MQGRIATLNTGRAPIHTWAQCPGCVAALTGGNSAPGLHHPSHGTAGPGGPRILGGTDCPSLEGTTPKGKASRVHHPKQGIPPDTWLVHNVLPRVGRSQSPESSGTSVCPTVPNIMLYMCYIWLIPNPTEWVRTAPPSGRYIPLGMYSQTSAWCFPFIGVVTTPDGVASAWKDALNFINFIMHLFLASFEVCRKVVWHLSARTTSVLLNAGVSCILLNRVYRHPHHNRN